MKKVVTVSQQTGVGRRMLVAVLAVLMLLAMAPMGAGASANTGLLNEATGYETVRPDVVTIDARYEVPMTRDYFLTGVWYTRVPELQTFVGADGSISVLDTGEVAVAGATGAGIYTTPRNNVVIYEFSSSGQLTTTLEIEKPLQRCGGFTKDGDGNYYLFFAQEVAEGAFDEQNMVLVKYSSTGIRLQEFWLEARYGSSSSVKRPFRSGTCRLEISSGDMIAVYLAREELQDSGGINHQSALGFVLDINTFELLSRLGQEGAWSMNLMAHPRGGHSFDQFILPIENGFVFTTLGDSRPRGFGFDEAIKGRADNVRGESFGFEGRNGENWTDASMGGIAQTPSGYLFVGAYNQNKPAQGARNLFLLSMDERFGGSTDPIWITNYTNPQARAVAVKLVQIDVGRYAVMWEVQNYALDDRSDSDARKAYLAVVDAAGEVLSVKEIIGAELNGYDVLRYNPVTGRVYWAVSYGDGKVNLYSLDPLEGTTTPTPPVQPPTTTLTVNPTPSTVYVNGEATQFEAYLINGNNYFKLRDLAFVLNGTNKQFSVGYDNATRAITLTSGEAYASDGGEMRLGDGAAKQATLNAEINISLDGAPVGITAYLIGGNNFMRLRDVMRLLDIGVGYDNATRNITIDTSELYIEE
ncbi:hypothetical protein FWH30_00320 [Microgenomates group bacterium]|nr:hypothetical protein [Microgenomates group bacterium]